MNHEQECGTCVANNLGPLETPTDHEKEAVERAAAGQYDAAQFHATMYAAQVQRTTALIAAVDKWGGETFGWPLAIREGLGL